MGFNPRRPRGRRPRLSVFAQRHRGFQSTPPTRAATAAGEFDPAKLEVSIHAAHAGGDYAPQEERLRSYAFQSTPPTRAATM